MKKIGSILILVWITSIFGAQPVHIALYDTHGMPVSCCVQGALYTLHISLHNLSVSTPISCTLPDGWRMHPGKTVKRHIEQGNTTITYVYTISPERLGTTTLGPLHVESGTDTYVSNSITVVVKEKDEKAITNTPARALLVCNIPVTQAYVGQEIPCLLQFCYIPNQVSLEQIGKPDIADVTMSDWSGPYTGNKEINGVIYEYIEWRWSIHFSKPGNYELPAYRADYIDFTKKQQSRTPFDLFFNTNSLQTLYSNIQRILVKPLPYDASNTQAVGRISAYTMTSDKTECKVGDAVVLSLMITGHGNFGDIDAPRLTNIPTGLKYYDSKKEKIHTACEPTVCLQYIVQPMQEGTWDIPAQQYIYFDPYDASYKTIESNAISLKVLPKIMAISSSEESDRIYTQPTGLCAIGTRLPLAEHFHHIPWQLFFLLASLPILCMIGYSIYIFYIKYCEKNKISYNAKTAFDRAKRRIKIVKNISQLYYIFLHCFSDWWMVDSQILTEQYIYIKLKHAGMPEVQLHEWELFWQKCMHAAFVSQAKEVHDTYIVINDAIRWCEILKHYR